MRETMMEKQAQTRRHLSVCTRNLQTQLLEMCHIKVQKFCSESKADVNIKLLHVICTEMLGKRTFLIHFSSKDQHERLQVLTEAP